jgi:large subunit ribosomal protein L4
MENVLKVPVYDWEKNVVDEMILPEFIFSSPIRKDIMARVVLWQLSKRRSGNHKTKGISDISGTTRKPYKQKGTGRARQGSLRSPQFRGGAVIFGPVVRSHAFSLPKKVRSFGLRSVLSARLSSQDVLVFNELKEVPLKTKMVAKVFSEKTLIVASGDMHDKLKRVLNNVSQVNLLHCDGINVYDILRHDKLVLFPDVISSLEKRFVQ